MNMVGEDLGDQLAKKCNMATIKRARRQSPLQVEVDPTDGQERPSPAGDLIYVPMGVGRTMKIGSALSLECRDVVAALLKEYQDTFAWAPSDIPSIDATMKTHCLTVDPQARPITQKRHSTSAERHVTVIEEVNPLLDASFIRKVLSELGG